MGDPRFFSLFSGALGLDLGFEAAGWECLGVAELDPVACATIRANRPGLRLFEGDVRGLSADGLRRELGLRRGGLDALIGGPPCQAFSTAGRRRSVQDPRGDVVFHFLELARALEPHWVVVENVRGLLSAPLRHRPHSERDGAPAPEERPGGALARVVATLEAAGYAVSFQLYDAVRFGVPQRRERLLLVAGRDGERARPLVPTVRNGEGRTVRGAFVAPGMDPTHAALRPRQVPYLRLLGPGQNWRDLPEHLQEEAMGRAFRSTGGRVGFFRRVAWDEPSPTLVTSPSMPATLLAHPEELRTLSVGEYKRLQGFPDSWEVVGSLAAQYRQLGNAVPVGLAQALATHLIRPEQSPTEEPTSRYRRTDDRAWREDHEDVLQDAFRAALRRSSA